MNDALGPSLLDFPSSFEKTLSVSTGMRRSRTARSQKRLRWDRRIEPFLKYYNGYGAIIVQLNVEDTRNGIAEYVIGKYGEKVITELKWGRAPWKRTAWKHWQCP